MRRIGILLTALAFLAAALPASAGLAEKPGVADAIALLDLWIEEQRAYRELPGLAVGVVVDQELIWARGYGVRDLETGEPVTPRTVFRLGSITKLFTSTAVMQLRDRGLLRLDDPVVRHLPRFAVQSDFEGEPEVTVRHLLVKKADPAWQRFVGVYADPWGWEYRVMVLDDQLAIYEHSYPPDDEPDGGLTRLEPAGGNRFRMDDGEHVVFELDADGKVERVRRRYDYIYPVEHD